MTENPTTSKKKQGRTQTMTTASRSSEPSPYAYLEPMEEKVIRMRFGLSENDEKTLDYAVGASEDTRNRVTFMEAANIADLDGNVPVSAGASREELNDFVQRIDFKDLV